MFVVLCVHTYVYAYEHIKFVYVIVWVAVVFA